MKKLIFMFLLAISFLEVNARKFYFSSTSGNDSYTTTQAQNQATPWKTLIQLENAYRTLRVFAAGDTICFKRGDVFSNGRDQFGSMKWWNDGTAYFNAPSGTELKPIVFTNFGDPLLELPNFLFPNPGTAVTSNNSRHCLSFEGVGYLVFDGLQFSDYRFSYTDKVSAAYTTTGLHLGERPTGFNTGKDVHHITVKNCKFSNLGYGIMSAGSYITISRNNFTNFKSVGDTSGTSIFSDIGSDPIQPQGDHYLIEYNYMKGGWSYSSPYATGQGKVGGAIEVINDFDHSKIIFNTIVDCEGMYEFGRNVAGDTLLGPNDDTTAYNIIINSGKIAYIHTGTSQFAVRAARLRFWNNFYIENNFSRFTGPNFGNDIYNDGQSFIQMPGWALGFPKNPSDYNYGGHRIIQYPSETVKGNPDTLVDFRNNIIWNTTGLQQIYDASRTKFIHANNIYHLVGRKTYASALGGSYNSGNFLEINSTNKLITDTSNINPEQWNFTPESSSQVINFGRNVGLNVDIDGSPIISNPDAGVQEYQNATAALTVNVSTGGTINCYGSTTTVTVSASGGVPPYSGTGNFTASGGTQNYTVLDAAGSRQTASIIIPQPSSLVPTVTAGPIIIFGNTTSITASATGGTGSYTYKLNSGSYQTSGTFTNVAAGTHTITVKDANNCTATSTIVITQPAALLNLTLSAASNPIACNGGNTAITANASGGTAPYTYALGSGTFQTSNQFTGITAGTYTFNVKDANGITKSTSISITQPSTAISGNVSSGTISSYGGKTTITVSSVSGGSSPYSYSLNGGTFQTTTSFSNVGAGTHTITIKDSRGCTLIKTITITQPASTLACNATAGTIACNGGTATVTVTATGGTAPYTGTGTFTVSAGTYSYNVTDAAGSVKTTSITINQPSAIAPTVTAGPIIIFGNTTSITASATGGTGSYTYKLNSGSYQTSGTFTNVAAGTHTITVKDANNCTATNTIVITQPAALLNLTLSAASNPIACNGGNTAITANASGGTAPYTYALGSGTYQTSNQFTGITAGTYTFNVKDANNITKSTSISITQPSTAISGNVSSGTISSYGGKTTITVSSVSGGSSPYSYSLNGGTFQTTTSFSNVGAGTHTITIKDSRGCTIIKTITITQPASTLACNATAGTIACNGGTATVTVAASGGTAPYTGTGTFTVSAGTYTYNVTDAVGSVKTTSITVNQPSAIAPTLTAGRIIIFGNTTSITASATGGTGSYTYKLNSGSYQTSGTFTNVAAGTHTITVKDANNCTATNTIVITQPAALLNLTLSAASNPIACNGGNTAITANASGGTAPYTYALGSGTYQTSNQFTGITAGTYTFNVKDANNITKSTSISITQPTALATTVSAGTTSSTGTATVTVSNTTGGSSPYSFSIDGGVYQTGTTFTGIVEGIHSVNVKDSKGCILTKSVTVLQRLSVVVLNITHQACRWQSDGAVSIGGSGGVPPYQYQISSYGYSTTNVFTRIMNGNYTVYVKDATGAIASLIVAILPSTVTCNRNSNNDTQSVDNKPNINTEEEFNIFPNPSSSEFNVIPNRILNGNFTYQLFNATGQIVRNGKLKNDKITPIGRELKSGVYFLKVSDGKLIETKKLIKL